jgi:hypothetical protein
LTASGVREPRLNDLSEEPARYKNGYLGDDEREQFLHGDLHAVASRRPYDEDCGATRQSVLEVTDRSRTGSR